MKIDEVFNYECYLLRVSEWDLSPGNHMSRLMNDMPENIASRVSD